jgi:hypothetical protein
VKQPAGGERVRLAGLRRQGFHLDEFVLAGHRVVAADGSDGAGSGQQQEVFDAVQSRIA